MKTGKHTIFMINFIKDFIEGEIDCYFFKMDYCAYVIEHFPHMEEENPRLADRFAETIDYAYEYGTKLKLSDDEFRTLISDAFDKWIGKTKRSTF
jgi:predicted ATPase